MIPPALEAGVGLYRGPLLAGFSESWITYERQKRQSAYLRGIGLLHGARPGHPTICESSSICA